MVYRYPEFSPQNSWGWLLMTYCINWSDHISYLSGKIAMVLGMMHRVKKVLPRHFLVSIYKSLIIPYLYYCTIIWGNATQSILTKLIVLQNKCIRLITGSNYRASTDNLYNQLNLLKLTDIYKLQVLIFTCRFKLGLFDGCSLVLHI